MLLESILVIRRRGCYRRTLEALRRGSITIGCIGGSITAAAFTLRKFSTG